MPKSRMPYTLAPIAKALDWPAGAVDSLLEGGEPPGGWQNVRAQIDDDTVAAILTNAIVRATDNATAAEIRKATQLALDDLRRHGFLSDTERVQLNELNGNT